MVVRAISSENGEILLVSQEILRGVPHSETEIRE